jgi:hypothetical protein
MGALEEAPVALGEAGFPPDFGVDVAMHARCTSTTVQASTRMAHSHIGPGKGSFWLSRRKHTTVASKAVNSVIGKVQIPYFTEIKHHPPPHHQ